MLEIGSISFNLRLYLEIYVKYFAKKGSKKK